MYRLALESVDSAAAEREEGAEVEPLALPAALDMVAVYRDGVLAYACPSDFDLRDEVIAQAAEEIAKLRGELAARQAAQVSEPTARPA